METTGDRVRRLIEQAGLTQGAFAEQIDVEQTKLSKSLSGTRRFTSLELALIAENRGVTVDWLLTGAEPELATAARRAAGSSSATAVGLAKGYVTRREGLARLGLPQQVSEVSAVPAVGRDIDQGAALAERALARVAEHGLSVSDGLAEVIETAFGIDVAVEDLGAGFDGLAVATERVRLILVHATTNTARQRFTMAHELGHLLAGDDQGVHEDRDIYSAESKRGAGERRANAFAAAFLMPEVLLRALVAEKGYEVPGLAAVSVALGVSPLALGYRLKDLRIIDAGIAGRLGSMSAQEASRQAGASAAFSQQQQGSLRRRPPGLMLADALAAYERGAATLRVYAQLLGVTTESLREEWAAPEGAASEVGGD